MDQDLSWWCEVVFGGWRERPGPRYQRLAGCVLDAIDRREVSLGVRLPAERTLGAALGVSRGTVAACFEHLTAAGVLRRRQGSGTSVIGRPSWASTPAATSVASLLLRRMAGDRQTIDLSVSAPGDLRHLPAADLDEAWAALDGHGLEPVGSAELRGAIAEHLSVHQRLPTHPDQLVITAGAQEALSLLSRVLHPQSGTVVTTCPTYPGLRAALAGSRRAICSVAGDEAGPDPAAVGRASRRGGSLIYLMPAGHNPTGAVTAPARVQALADIAEAGPSTVVEDLALADLHLGGEVPPLPLAALSTKVVAVGSTSKLLWGGLRVGWIRAEEPLRTELIAHKADLNLATAAISQLIAARLLRAIDIDWLRAHRAAICDRRDRLAALIETRLPSWRYRRPDAGLSLWVELPVVDAGAFVHVAARHGVRVAAGRDACIDDKHNQHIRLSYAEQPDTLELAVERLSVAWEVHCENLAANVRTSTSTRHPQRGG